MLAGVFVVVAVVVGFLGLSVVVASGVSLKQKRFINDASVAMLYTKHFRWGGFASIRYRQLMQPWKKDD